MSHLNHVSEHKEWRQIQKTPVCDKNMLKEVVDPIKLTLTISSENNLGLLKEHFFVKGTPKDYFDMVLKGHNTLIGGFSQLKDLNLVHNLIS